MKITFLKKPLILISLLFIILVMVACGQETEKTDESETADNTHENKETENSSNQLVVYTAGPKGLAENIKEGFEAETGITIEQFQGTTGKVLGRLEAEKSNPMADVVVLASWPAAIGLKEDGWTQSYEEAAHADKLHSTWKDDEHHFFGYSASALGITYNTNLVETPPTDWSDLSDDVWEDSVNIPDLSLSGSALDFVSGYVNEYGDEGWQTFEQLKANGVMMAGANAEALDPVITGSKKAVMAGVDYMAYSAKAKGEPVDIIYPTSGTVINPRPVMILESAPNVENAQRFIDYILSDEAQGIVADAYLLPGRTDIEVKDRVATNDIKLLNYDWNWMMENSDEISNKFINIFK